MHYYEGIHVSRPSDGAVTQSGLTALSLVKSIDVPSGYRTKYVKLTLTFSFDSAASSITAAPMSSLFRNISIGPSYVDAAAINRINLFFAAINKPEDAAPVPLGANPSVAAVNTTYTMIVFIPVSFDGTREVIVQTNAASSFNAATSAVYTLQVEPVYTDSPGKLFEVDFRVQSNLSLFTAIAPGEVFFLSAADNLSSVINTISPSNANLTAPQIDLLQNDLARALNTTLPIADASGNSIYGLILALESATTIQINTSGAATLVIGELYEA